MTTRFDKGLRFGYGFSIVILLLVSVVSYVSLHNLLKSNQAVEHSSEIIHKLELLLSVVKDAETGQRGYLLSGKRSYLEPYSVAYPEAARLADQLIILTEDNAKQQENIITVKRIIEKRLNILERLVEKKDRGEAIDSTDMDSGKSAMDELRLVIGRASVYEKILQKERTARLNRYTAVVQSFIILAALLTIGFVVFSYRKLIRDYKDKENLRLELEASQKDTLSLNEELSTANEEITASNEELMASNEDLLRAREDLVIANNFLEEKVAERTIELLESEQETQALNEELLAINEDLGEKERILQKMVDELRHADERSAKLAAIVESSDDAIIGKNLNGIITSWNRGAEQIFGYNESEMVGESILKLIPEDLQHEEPVILSRLRNGEKIDHYETIRRTKDGRLIHVSLTISPICDKGGKVMGVSKIARDITIQKQDEQRKNDFIAMASHELKTPLTSLSALIQMLEKKLHGSSDPFIPQALGKANMQAKKMNALINGFLNVSRLESGKLEIWRKSFDLIILINELLEEVRLAFNSHDFSFEHQAPVHIFADRDKIGSVISNLLSNAVKYSPGKESVKMFCSIQSNEVMVSIQDDGIGIHPKDLKRIFDRYYRSSSDNTRNISGFGVGLYLSAEIIHLHRGRIWVESEKGKGSTFRFTLPLNEPAGEMCS
jgi:PAS domain S-box-containing protein